MSTGPIFVVGMNGSGTTMLADSLGRHPDIYSMPQESKVLPYYLNRYGASPELDSVTGRMALAMRIGREKPFWQSNGKRNVRLTEDELCEPGFAGVVNAIYHKLMEGSEKKRWCDKSPINTQHIVALAKVFSGSQFVHIIRDGRDAAQSFHRRWGYHPLHTITRWKHVVEEGRRQGVSLPDGRYMEVSYEHLTAQPRKTMADICKFLNVDFAEEVLQSSMRYMDPGNAHAQKSTIIKNSGKWRSYFDKHVVSQMESISGGALKRFGYNVDIEGDIEPNALVIKYWRLQDGMRFAHHFFTKYGLKAAPYFISHVISSAKQWASARH